MRLAGFVRKNVAARQTTFDNKFASAKIFGTSLFISSLRHYAVSWACSVECFFLSLTQKRKECHCKIYWSYLFCQLCSFSHFI